MIPYHIISYYTFNITQDMRVPIEITICSKDHQINDYKVIIYLFKLKLVNNEYEYKEHVDEGYCDNDLIITGSKIADYGYGQYFIAVQGWYNISQFITSETKVL